MMSSLSIALIHNNQVDRLAHVRPAIKDLAIALGDRFHVDAFEICWQPDVKSHGLFNALMRDGLYRHLAREWAVYRKIGISPFARDWVSFLKYALRKYLLRKSERLVWQRNSAIEMIVTAKHMRAWEVFVESNADYLLVFEDDVRFRPDTIARFNDQVIPTIRSLGNRALYVNLAGGCQYEDLRIEKLESKRNGDLVFYSKPVTNTACAYLINKSLVKKFVSKLVEQPLLRLIGIDWLMNKLFISMGDDAEKCVCVHFYPTIFDHGSFTGQYISWQK